MCGAWWRCALPCGGVSRPFMASGRFEFSRTKADIPDWLLDDTASGSGQIAQDRKLTEEFLNRRVRRPRRRGWLSARR